MNRITSILFMVSVILMSCVAGKTLPNLSGDPASAVENGKNEFVELKDGRIVEGHISKQTIDKSAFGGMGNLTIDERTFSHSEVAAFQQKGTYYRIDKYHVINERIVKGRINVYRSTSVVTPAGHYYDQFCLQKGDRSPLEEFSLKILSQMVEDYHPAVDKLAEYKAMNQKQRNFKGNIILDKVIEMYNNQ